MDSLSSGWNFISKEGSPPKNVIKPEKLPRLYCFQLYPHAYGQFLHFATFFDTEKYARVIYKVLNRIIDPTFEKSLLGENIVSFFFYFLSISSNTRFCIFFFSLFLGSTCCCCRSTLDDERSGSRYTATVVGYWLGGVPSIFARRKFRSNDRTSTLPRTPLFLSTTKLVVSIPSRRKQCFIKSGFIDGKFHFARGDRDLRVINREIASNSRRRHTYPIVQLFPFRRCRPDHRLLRRCRHRSIVFHTSHMLIIPDD